jgi:hypothetical protein
MLNEGLMLLLPGFLVGSISLSDSELSTPNSKPRFSFGELDHVPNFDAIDGEPTLLHLQCIEDGLGWGVGF